MKNIHYINAGMTIGVLGLFGVGMLLLGLETIGVPTQDIEGMLLIIGAVSLMPLGVVQLILAAYSTIAYKDQFNLNIKKLVKYYWIGVGSYALAFGLWWLYDQGGFGINTPILPNVISTLYAGVLYATPFLLALYFVYVTRQMLRYINSNKTK